MKTNTTLIVLLLFLISPAQSDTTNASPIDLIGEYQYDLTRSAKYNAQSRGIKLDEETSKQLEEHTTLLESNGSLPIMTITKDAMITHENDFNKEQRATYKVIGGNAALVIVELQRQGHLPTISHIYIDSQGIGFAQPSCNAYPQQCARLKDEYLKRSLVPKAATDTSTNSSSALISSDISDDQLEQMWQHNQRERHYFKPRQH